MLENGTFRLTQPGRARRGSGAGCRLPVGVARAGGAVGVTPSRRVERTEYACAARRCASTFRLRRGSARPLGALASLTNALLIAWLMVRWPKRGRLSVKWTLPVTRNARVRSCRLGTSPGAPTIEDFRVYLRCVRRGSTFPPARPRLVRAAAPRSPRHLRVGPDDWKSVEFTLPPAQHMPAQPTRVVWEIVALGTIDGRPYGDCIPMPSPPTASRPASDGEPANVTG